MACRSFSPEFKRKVVEEHLKGGYEVDNAVRYYGTTMQKPESEALILYTAGQAVAELVR